MTQPNRSFFSFLSWPAFRQLLMILVLTSLFSGVAQESFAQAVSGDTLTPFCSYGVPNPTGDQVPGPPLNGQQLMNVGAVFTQILDQINLLIGGTPRNGATLP